MRDLGAFLKSLRGPLMMICLGILLLLQQQNVLPFSRTWPILVILLGSLILIERAVSKPQVPPQGGFGSGPMQAGGLQS